MYDDSPVVSPNRKKLCWANLRSTPLTFQPALLYCAIHNECLNLPRSRCIYRTFHTRPNGVGMTELNSLASLPTGYVIANAIGINNAGQVLVSAASYVPEPETYALMLAGLGLIGFAAWRQKSGNRIYY